MDSKFKKIDEAHVSNACSSYAASTAIENVILKGQCHKIFGTLVCLEQA